MIDLFFAGGPLFMFPLTLVALAVLAAAVRGGLSIRQGRDPSFWSRLVFHLGLFAFVLGILSQAISLYQMMGAIQAAGDVAPAIVMGGLRVSLIAPFYAIGIFLAALLLRFVLDAAARSSIERAGT